MVRLYGFLTVAGLALSAGCTSSEVLIAHTVDLQQSPTEVPEAQLLDVAVSIFDPGVPEGELSRELLEELIDEGIFAQIRRSESIYMAVALQETLQTTGHWGQIWVTPDTSNVADLNIEGLILHSDGEQVRVRVTATDASGRVWLDDRYEATIAAGAYNRGRYAGMDPYQDIFSAIANDLAALRAEFPADELADIRTIAALKYAADLSPDAFDDYLAEQRNGTYTINRLPATNDTQFDRTQRARQRERIFYDTLNQHYVSFSSQAVDSYDSWRSFSREEAIQLREMTRSINWRRGLGAASIAASLLYGGNFDNDFAGRVARDAIMYIGVEMLQWSAARRQEKQLHRDMLQEMSQDFDDEVAPLVVDIQGTQHRLTGTVDAQVQAWQDLLRELYRSETGFEPEEDVEMYLELPEETPVPSDESESSPAETEARENSAGGAGGETSGA